jgi:hypothetical protein
MTLVRIVKNWDWPDLFRQTPGGKGIWDNIQFTCDDIEECDYLVFLNNCMKTPVRAFCAPENIWVVMQEPYERGLTDWVAEGHENFSKVFTHYSPSNNPKYIPSQPALPWHVNRSYDQLISCTTPRKTKGMSSIVGDAMYLPGHFQRWNFLGDLKSAGVPYDLFGKKIQYLEDKWDGLAPYRYSLAIENNSGPDLWTEKLADCFLTWTLPFYYGCTNLEEYFPKDSFVRIDITNPEKSIRTIKEVTAEKDWEKHIPALSEARNLILRKYQIFPYLSRLISLEGDSDKQKEITFIPPYRRSAKTYWHKRKFKIKRRIGKILGNRT